MEKNNNCDTLKLFMKRKSKRQIQDTVENICASLIPPSHLTFLNKFFFYLNVGYLKTTKIKTKKNNIKKLKIS